MSDIKRNYIAVAYIHEQLLYHIALIKQCFDKRVSETSW